MTATLVIVKFFARRKEGGKWRFWGWGKIDGEVLTFWMLTRKRGFTFKPIGTYSPPVGIEVKVAEQQAKGYAETELSTYYQRKIDRCYGISMIAGTLHVGRRKR